MIESLILEAIISNGILGAVCAFFMIKDIRKDAKLIETNNKIVLTLSNLALVIDERLPKR